MTARWRYGVLGALGFFLVACAAARPLELEDVRTETPMGAVELFDSTGHPINSRLPDFAGMVTDVAKQRLQEELLKRLPGQAKAPTAPPGGGSSGSGDPRDVIKDRLKGIFGR